MSIQANPNYIKDDVDLREIRKAIQSGNGWFKIVDPLHPRHGSIFKITMPAGLASRSPVRSLGVQNPFKYEYKSFCDNKKPIDLGGKKPVNLQLTRILFELLENYTGGPVDCFNSSKTFIDPGFQDLMGNHITLKSFVAASNGSGMVLGNVEELFAERSDYQIKFKAKVKVLVDDSDTNKLVPTYYWGPHHPVTMGVNIRNLVVITDDIKKQSMLKKLGMI